MGSAFSWTENEAMPVQTAKEAGVKHPKARWEALNLSSLRSDRIGPGNWEDTHCSKSGDSSIAGRRALEPRQGQEVKSRPWIQSQRQSSNSTKAY